MQTRTWALLTGCFLVLLSMGCTKDQNEFCVGGKKTLDQFLQDSSLTTEITNNGSDTVRYIIVNEGEVRKPGPRDTVRINYVGKTTTNEEIDASAGVPLSAILAGLIRGFQVGLPLIGEGGSIRLFIPARSAYGNNPPPTICPGTDLIFTVDLVDIGFFVP